MVASSRNGCAFTAGAASRKRPSLRGVAVALVVIAVGLAACSGGARVNVLLPDGAASFTLMDFRTPLPLDPVPEGWFHRTFLRHPPMDISFVTKDGRHAIRLATSDSASMLFRYVDVELDAYAVLTWDWYIERPIASDADEMTVGGDDHPARIYLTFEALDGKSRAMEIIWGNRLLRAGDWKHLKFFGLFSFPHYVANGGDENARKWHHESVDLRELHQELWGEPAGVRLVEVALFCDTDETGSESVAYFSDIRVEQAR